MATTTKAAAPAKKSGFQGVKAAWIILVICALAGYGVTSRSLCRYERDTFRGMSGESITP